MEYKKALALAVRLLIEKRLKSGISFNRIGVELSLSAAEVIRIHSGKYPGEKVAARLGIPIVCHACHRRIPVSKIKILTEVEEWLLWWRRLPSHERGEIIKSAWQKR